VPSRQKLPGAPGRERARRGLEQAWIRSQVEVLLSNKIGLAVVDELALLNDPIFMSPPRGALQQAKALFRAIVDIFRSQDAPQDEPAESENQQRREAAETLQSGLVVERVNESYVLNVQFTWHDPILAAIIVRATAEAYLADQLNAQINATRAAGSWAQQRMTELQQKALQSDLAVQRFRADHGLIAASGKLVSEQQLSELNSQLILARGETAAAQTKYERLHSIINSAQTEAITAGSLDSNIINALRQEYLEASKEVSEISAHVGSEHIRVKQLQSSMQEYGRLIFEELGRIAENYRSEYQAAKAREASLTKIVNDATGVSAVANEILVQLRELEREADTYRDLYQQFLLRYQESVQQESFPTTEARIISEAAVPKEPSGPSKSLVLGLCMALGLSLGAGLGFLQEYRERFFRTSEQVIEELGLEFLGLVPLEHGRSGIHSGESSSADPRQITNYAVDRPLSLFAETMRSAKIAADVALGRDKPKIIGVEHRG